MAHEIEADFVCDYHNESQQCKNCTSFKENPDSVDQGFCTEAKSDVPLNAHCDFFQSKD